MERLQKIIAQAGLASRRKAEKMIIAGRVKVNGQKVTELGTKVDPVNDTITVDDETILKERLVYLMLNKPKGYITTADDPYDRRIVLDLLKDVSERIHPVGRLDADTEGLLLLTNDGGLTYALTHPRHKVGKVYLVTCKGKISRRALRSLAEGVELEDGKTAPAEVSLIKHKRDLSMIKILIHEGRNRQVRRMMEAVEFPVLRLKRVQIGPLVLGKLRSGSYRHLTKKEVKLLKKIESSVVD